MGNHGSRRDHRKWGRNGGKAARALTRVEELRGPSVDSYDKLIAWLAEMAETDNVQLDTSVFVSQLNQVCGGGQSRNNYLDVTGTAVGASGGGHSGRRATNLRQHSASCDSHVSHTSSDMMSTSRQKGSTRSEDLLDPRSTWRLGINSRQTTFSDDLGEEDSEVRNASMESLYSNSDRDDNSEFGSLVPGEHHHSRTRGVKGHHHHNHHQVFSSNCSPILQRLQMKKNSEIDSGLGISCSCSTGNLDALNCYEDLREARTAKLVFSQRRSVSLLNLFPREVISPPPPSIPKVVLTSEDDELWGVAAVEGATAAVASNPKPQPVACTKAITPNIRRKHAKIERMYSLHSEPTGGVSKPPPISSLPPAFSLTTPESSEIPAIVGGTPSHFLNDALLDGNLADILFSVEALWPNK